MEENEKQNEKEKPLEENILEKVESRITQIINAEGVKRDNVDYLYKLVDIHKDLKNENYWKIKEEKYHDEIQRKLQRKLRRIRSKKS